MPSPTNHLTGCFLFFCFWLSHVPFIVVVICLKSIRIAVFILHPMIMYSVFVATLICHESFAHVDRCPVLATVANACASFDSALYACLKSSASMFARCVLLFFLCTFLTDLLQWDYFYHRK